MPEYIDREAAYRFAQDQLKKETGAYSKGWNNAMNVMKGAFHNNDAIPAADVVPVVRCRECKHLCVHSGALGVYQCALHGDYPSGEYFCADGEMNFLQSASMPIVLLVRMVARA